MKFNITKIIVPVDLGEYHESYAGQFLQVWVNPPRQIRRQRDEILSEYREALTKMLAPALAPPPTPPQMEKHNLERGEKDVIKKTGEILKREMDEIEQAATQQLNRRMMEWLIELWNQHPDVDSRWSLDELIVLDDADPAFYAWLTRRTVEMISEYRASKKKALTTL